MDRKLAASVADAETKQNEIDKLKSEGKVLQIQKERDKAIKAKADKKKAKEDLQ